MELTRSRDSDSLLSPISGLLPSALLAEEARWLAKLLELEFEGRDAVLQQIAEARVSREVHTDYHEVFFDYPEGVPRPSPDAGFLVGMNVFADDRVRIPVDFGMFEGRTDYFLAYTHDSSALDLASTPLDDVEYDVAPYARKAKAYLSRIAEKGRVRNAAELGAALSAEASRHREPVASELEAVARSCDAVVSMDACPLSARVEVRLGEKGGAMYWGAVQRSLVGPFFFSYVYDEKEGPWNPAAQQLPPLHDCYPNGERICALRRAMYELGIMPLNIRYAEYPAGFSSLASDDEVHVRLDDCLFTGRGLL